MRSPVWKQSQVVRMYIPSTTDHKAITAFCSDHADGYTLLPGHGVWVGSDGEEHREAATVYEVVIGLNRIYADDALVDHGKQFLHDNPNEQCFMATFTDLAGTTRTLTINR